MSQAFCPACLAMRPYAIVGHTERFTIRGETIEFEAQVARCGTCGNDIGLEDLDDATLRDAYSLYRARHGLLQPQHIREIRSRYGLGQKAFARLLGWGEVTLARYETGALQSDAHDATLRLAEDPENVRRLLGMNRGRLSAEQIATLETRLGDLSADHEALLAREDVTPYAAAGPIRRLTEMTVFFAEQPDLWRTKLNKLLFYADFLHARRHGMPISGARYVHMHYGPAPADFYVIQASLVDAADIDEVCLASGDCRSTAFIARRPADRSIFSDLELETLRFVAAYFEGWSARRVTTFSRAEPGWAETADRETISLEYAQRLQLS